MRIGDYEFDEFLDVVRNFHGSPAPGIIIGGIMVDMARDALPPDTIFDAVVETPKCLPDAVQLLTLCTIGNGWLKIVNLGRYALTFYDKYTGKGVRVFVDPQKLKNWDEIRGWILKLKPKKEQNFERLIKQIKSAGRDILTARPLKVDLEQLTRKKMSSIALCPICAEPYPADDGAACRGCHGDSPYLSEGENLVEPELEQIPVQEAAGKKALHDMTGIVPGRTKGAVIKRGQEISFTDICRLQQIGRQNVYAQNTPAQKDWIHEDSAAESFSRAMAGEGVLLQMPPREGKINLVAAIDGLLVVNRENLLAFNLIPQVMCASRQGNMPVRKDSVIAGTRAIPLYLSSSVFNKAMQVLNQGSLFKILPFQSRRVGLLITGTEIFEGIIKDRFEPIIKDKVRKLGSKVQKTAICPDDPEKIKKELLSLLEAGCNLIVTTAGLSVDPDDVTRKAIQEAGANDILYGAPILPGAMTMLAWINSVPLIGVPACALYFKTTGFDLLLSRILAGQKITRLDLAQMAEGSLCLSCKACTYPKCPFGR